MARKARKDSKGRTLRKGESVRKSDGMYVYTYTDSLGKRRYVYASDLKELRIKEERLIRDQMDGLNTYVGGRCSLDYVFDRYIKTKTDLRDHTRQNYLYTYNHFVRDGFGKKKIGEVKYSDVLLFYQLLIEKDGVSVSTIDSIQTVLFPTFDLAVRDDIIRKNPCAGMMAEVKRRWGKKRKARRALSHDEQSAFVQFLSEAGQLIWRPIFIILLGTGARVGDYHVIIGLNQLETAKYKGFRKIWSYDFLQRNSQSIAERRKT